MGSYLIRRLLIAVPSLLGISVVLFTVLALAPGDPFEELATNPAVPPEVRTALRIKFGLDDPVALRYVRWLLAMLSGDWGYSFVSRVDVGTLILQRLPTTLFVIGTSQLLAILIAMPVGIYAATRPYSIFDQIANTFAFVGFSLPPFFTGLLFILVFSITLDWLPFGVSGRHQRERVAMVCRECPPSDHAHQRYRPLPGSITDPLCAVGDARRHPPATTSRPPAPRGSASASSS